jgi:hypothetical protein
MVRRSTVIEVTASDRMPDLVVRAKRGAVPSDAQDGTEVGRLPGGGRTARLELPPAALTLPAGVRVFPAASLPGREFTLTDPPSPALMITS